MERNNKAIEIRQKKETNLVLTQKLFFKNVNWQARFTELTVKVKIYLYFIYQRSYQNIFENEYNISKLFQRYMADSTSHSRTTDHTRCD